MPLFGQGQTRLPLLQKKITAVAQAAKTDAFWNELGEAIVIGGIIGGAVGLAVNDRKSLRHKRAFFSKDRHYAYPVLGASLLVCGITRAPVDNYIVSAASSLAAPFGSFLGYRLGGPFGRIAGGALFGAMGGGAGKLAAIIARA